MMLLSRVMPAAARISSAQSERSVTEKYGARYDVICRGAGPLQGHQRTVQVPRELVWSLAVDELVIVAVASDLVAGRQDALDQIGICLGDPPQHEKGRAGVVRGQQAEQTDW